MKIAIVVARVLLATASPGTAAALQSVYFRAHWLCFARGIDSTAGLSLLTNRVVPLAVALLTILTTCVFALPAFTAELAASRSHSNSFLAQFVQKAST